MYFLSPNPAPAPAQPAPAPTGVAPLHNLPAQGYSSPRSRPLRKDDEGVLAGEDEALSSLLSLFYLRFSPSEIGKVPSIVQDFAHRGGGVEEFNTLNDSLRRKFGQDLGPYSSLQGVRMTLAAQGPHGRRTVILERKAAANGSGSGVGLVVEVDPMAGLCRIVGIAAQSPALECRQIRVGDCIITVDGVSVAGLSARQVAAMLSGSEGSRVHIELDSAPGAQPASVSPAPLAPQQMGSQHSSNHMPGSQHSSNHMPMQMMSMSAQPEARAPGSPGGAGKSLRVSIRAARNIPSELTGMALYVTMEAKVPELTGRKNPALSRKTSSIVYRGGEDQVQWDSNSVLQIRDSVSELVVRLWAKSESLGANAEPKHAGYTSLSIEDALSPDIEGREIWYNLGTIDGHLITKNGSPLALAVTMESS